MSSDLSIREFCRRVLVEWVTHWPDPQRWKHEVRWMDDGVAVQSQLATGENVWAVAGFFSRSSLEHGSSSLVRWQALQCWRELQTSIAQQAQTGDA